MAKKSTSAKKPTPDTATPAPAPAPEAAAPAASAKPEKVAVPKQNGIKRPEPGSLTGKLWDIADEISGTLQRPAPRKDVISRYMTEVPGANTATANTQYARWVTFHGAAEALKSARADAAAEREKAKVAEREARAKERADAAAAKEKAAAEAKAAKDQAAAAA